MYSTRVFAIEKWGRCFIRFCCLCGTLNPNNSKWNGVDAITSLNQIGCVWWKQCDDCPHSFCVIYAVDGVSLLFCMCAVYVVRRLIDHFNAKGTILFTLFYREIVLIPQISNRISDIKSLRIININFLCCSTTDEGVIVYTRKLWKDEKMKRTLACGWCD